MKVSFIFLVGLLFILLSGCWIDEVQPVKEKSLCIVADRLTKEDSLVINQFGYDYHVKIRKEVLPAEAILKRVRKEKFNAEIDVFILENEDLRQELLTIKAYKTIQSNKLFSQLDRQFNNNHHQWIAICHDPLFVCTSKDSTDHCTPINAKTWHRNDDFRPQLVLTEKQKEYNDLLQKTAFHWLTQPPKTNLYSNERIYALSDYVKKTFHSDSISPPLMNECRYYLVDKKRTISRKCTLSLYHFGRNNAVAERFISFYMGNSYSIANGRNQLPTKKGTTPNWYIRSLSIQ